jgi:hypothetical protein
MHKVLTDRKKKGDVPFVSFLAVVGTIFMIISISVTLSSLSWDQQLLPDVDVSRCPPITSNTKRIWTFWKGGIKNMPIFIQENIKMWQLVNPDWEVRALHHIDEHDECHISKFINRGLSFVPIHLDEMSIPKQSDAVRIALIRLYGGVFMDVSILLFEPLEINFWNYVDRPKDDLSRKAMVGYYSDKFTLPGRKDGYEIWMIVAKAEEPMIVAWEELYMELYGYNYEPLIRNETTGELNPLFKGVDLSKLHETPLNYHVSTTTLHALLQLNSTWNFTYEHKSIIRNADETAFTLGNLFDWNSKKLYNHLFNREDLSMENIVRITKGVPLQKLINPAYYIKDRNHFEWRSLRNVMGLIRISLVERAKKFKKEGVWDYSLFH